MATYLKRTSKLFDLSLPRASSDVNLCDLICSVCRGILIEPVTLPCKHNLCLKCLKGTFEHNSLSCPLCRVRVGSWLRTATKSETLVNSKLWELIRTKFPKEVENKFNGDEGDIQVDAGLSRTNRILSAAGEIRREYEAQLQIVEEEMRRQREAAEKASEALIRKLHEEEQQKLVQLAQDELLAKSLAKKEITEIKDEVPLYSNRSLDTAATECSFHLQNVAIKPEPMKNAESLQAECSNFGSGNLNLSELKDRSELRRSNIALISKIRAERYASSMKSNPPSINKDSSVKFFCQKQMPVYNAVTKTFKHHPVTTFSQPSTSNYITDPGCSISKIYGTQSKEELHVPSDVLNSNKKSLGVEVCMTVNNDDERIGSAESAGSHDSINQEIHHFKPIKAMPRTPLKLSADGKHMDPKLIRVVPTIRRVCNIVPKPPSPTHLKRMIGCSWSAFRGKARMDIKGQQSSVKIDDTKVDYYQKPSTSLTQPQVISNTSKAQVPDAVRRFDFIPEFPFDSNKNYAKNINRIINGTKVSKKLILDEHVESGKVRKLWKTHVRNGMIAKSKRQKNSCADKMDVDSPTSEKDYADGESRKSAGSSTSTDVAPPEEQQDGYSENTTLENIAERIKKRKTNKDNVQTLGNETQPDVVMGHGSKKNVTPNEKKASAHTVSTRNSVVIQKRNKRKIPRKVVPKAKTRQTAETLGKSLTSVDADCMSRNSPVRKSTRNHKMPTRYSARNKKQCAPDKKANDDRNYNLSESCDEEDEYTTDSEDTGSLRIVTEKGNILDDEVIKDQERIERLVLQEKEDFELARRLQAQFDEMERVAGRRTRSRKAVENVPTDFVKYDVGRSVHRRTGARTAKQSVVNQSMTSEIKKRGRPPKRVLK